MKRLFYLVDNIDSVESISKDLHDEGVTDWCFHVLGKNETGLYTRQLHAANIFEKKDVIRFVERGALIGALVGLIIVSAGLVTGYPPMSGGAWLALFLFSVVVGAWIAGFGGITAENYKIRPFHDDIEQGKYLVLVDVPKKHDEAMRRLMAKNHPEATLQAEDSNHNNPFSRGLQHIRQ